MRYRDDRYALIDSQAVTFEADEFPRIVGDRPNGLQTKIEKNLRANAVVAQVGLEAESFVRFHRIDSLILELVRLELVEETDPAPFLVKVDDDAFAFLGDHFHRRVELPAAVATQGMEDVAGEALRVHSHQHAGIRADIAVDEGDVLVGIDVVSVTHHAPGAHLGGKTRFSNAVNEPLRLQAVGDDLSDGDESEAVLLRELFQLRPARARAVLVQDFANHSGRLQSGESCQIDRRLGVPDALENPAVARAQRRNVARPAEV